MANDTLSSIHSAIRAHEAEKARLAGAEHSRQVAEQARQAREVESATEQREKIRRLCEEEFQKSLLSKYMDNFNFKAQWVDIEDWVQATVQVEPRSLIQGDGHGKQIHFDSWGKGVGSKSYAVAVAGVMFSNDNFIWKIGTFPTRAHPTWENFQNPEAALERLKSFIVSDKNAAKLRRAIKANVWEAEHGWRPKI